MRFSFERNKFGEPMFEEFAKKAVTIDYRGHQFALFGAPDGIMRYVTDDGEVLRVGLEVKSKQTTAARTSDYSMRAPEESHVKQTYCYSIMYDVDYYVILYVNGAKKSWDMEAEEYRKNPDIRAFGIAIGDEERRSVLDYFAGILDARETKTPPPLDIWRFKFNNFKQACAKSLSDDELASLKREVSAISRSRLPDWKKNDLAEALANIEQLRAEVTV